MLLASAVVVWEWLNEHGRWRPYSPAVSHHIEAVIRSDPRGAGSVVLGQVDSRLSPYIIDLQSMHQFRQDTGERPRHPTWLYHAASCSSFVFNFLIKVHLLWDQSNELMISALYCEGLKANVCRCFEWKLSVGWVGPRNHFSNSLWYQCVLLILTCLFCLLQWMWNSGGFDVY